MTSREQKQMAGTIGAFVFGIILGPQVGYAIGYAVGSSLTDDRDDPVLGNREEEIRAELSRTLSVNRAGLWLMAGLMIVIAWALI